MFNTILQNSSSIRRFKKDGLDGWMDVFEVNFRFKSFHKGIQAQVQKKNHFEEKIIWSLFLFWLVLF